MPKFIEMKTPYEIEAVDISVYQDYDKNSNFVGVDFVKARSTRPSLRGLAVKAGEGLIDYSMQTFLGQAVEAHNAGFGVMPYHFWRYAAGASAQARYYFDRVRELPWKPNRVAVDVEDADNPTSKPPSRVLLPSEYPAEMERARKTMRALKNYVNAIADLFGQLPVFYTADWCLGWALDFANMGGEDLSWLNQIDFWIASYTSPTMVIPNLVQFEQVCMWQWTSEPPVAYQVNGFPWKERLDMNWWLWDEKRFKQVFGPFNGVEPEKTLEERVIDLEKRVSALEGKCQA